MTTALPTQVTYGTFKGKLIDAINAGAGEVSRAVTGTATASPAVNSVNIPAALVVMLPRPVTVTLDANGAFTMQLVATDDPALSIINWAYQISFQLGNGDALAPFLVQIPGGSTVDLSTANPVSTGGGVVITQGPAGPTAVFDVDAVPYLNATAPTPTGPGVQPTSKRLVTEASTVFDSRYKDTTKAPGAGNPYIIRTIADPEQTNSKWRELIDTALWQTNKPDPVFFFGWNANKAQGGGDPAEPAMYMGFEADYWDTPTNRTMEWYIGIIRADQSGPQFRPFAFTAARDSNLDLSASVQIDIGNNANGSTRSSFNVIAGGPSILAVTPTGLTIAAPVAFRNNIQVVGGGIVTGSTNTLAGHITFLNKGVEKWYLANFSGDTSHYLWDSTAGRFITHYTTGATSDTAQMEVNATLKLNGTQPTAAAAGTAAALPATPQGYFQIKDAAGVSRKVPYYV